MSRFITLLVLCLSTFALGCTGAAVKGGAMGGPGAGVDNHPPPTAAQGFEAASPEASAPARPAVLPADLGGVEGGCPGGPDMEPGLQQSALTGDARVTIGAY